MAEAEAGAKPIRANAENATPPLPKRFRKRLPTNLEILNLIYESYADNFRTYIHERSSRLSPIYVPIDIDALASQLQTDPQELWGRLYYHLDHKHQYKTGSDSMTHLFTYVEGDGHSINYPYLAGLVAEHRLEDRRNRWSLLISIVSLVLAVVAIIAQFASSSG